MIYACLALHNIQNVYGVSARAKKSKWNWKKNNHNNNNSEKKTPGKNVAAATRVHVSCCPNVSCVRDDTTNTTLYTFRVYVHKIHKKTCVQCCTNVRRYIYVYIIYFKNTRIHVDSCARAITMSLVASAPYRVHRVRIRAYTCYYYITEVITIYYIIIIRINERLWRDCGFMYTHTHWELCICLYESNARVYMYIYI